MMPDGGVVALVPVRGLRNGKTRLAEDLTVEARETLTWRMLRGVVRAALGSGVVAAVGVVSPDPAVLAMAAGIDRAVVPLAQDPGAPGLNAAVAAGRAWAQGRGAAALLVLFGDLPLLTGEDVRRLVAHEAAVVMAPDRHATGTNALLLRLDGEGRRFRFQFGAESYARHVAEAERLGLATATSVAPGTAVDLDTPEDWWMLLEGGGRGGAIVDDGDRLGGRSVLAEEGAA